MVSQQGHVRDSVQQIYQNSWLIGSGHVIHLVEHGQDPPPGQLQHLWGDKHSGPSYILYGAPSPLPRTSLLSNDSHVRLIHDAGEASAVFSFGDALILKAKLRTPQLAVPHEHETIAFLSKQRLSFKVPEILFQAQKGNTTFLLESRIPGQTVNEAWWGMDPAAKKQVATRVAEIVKELAAFQSSIFTSGVIDYNWISPLVEDENKDYTPEVLKRHCESLGMDCSTYVLSHNDLGPTNVILYGEQISIIDWDMAGYCPLSWVRTKFAICGVMAVERMVGGQVEDDHQYRKLIEQELGKMGFPEVTKAYLDMRDTRHAKWLKNRPWLQQ